MAKFLFVYRSDAEQEQQQPSPEQMQEIMANWGRWFGELGQAVLDTGDGLIPTGKLIRGDAVTDGPFIEAKEIVGGYSVIEAKDYDQAVTFGKACPVVAEGGSVEIRELAGFGEPE